MLSCKKLDYNSKLLKFILVKGFIDSNTFSQVFSNILKYNLNNLCEDITKKFQKSSLEKNLLFRTYGWWYKLFCQIIICTSIIIVSYSPNSVIHVLRHISRLWHCAGSIQTMNCCPRHLPGAAVTLSQQKSLDRTCLLCVFVFDKRSHFWVKKCCSFLSFKCRTK